MDINLNEQPGYYTNPEIVTTCINKYAKVYNVDELLFRAIIKTEGAKKGQIIKNSNNSYDLGVAQINTIHLQEPWFHKFYPNTSASDIANNICLSINIGSRILSHRMKQLKPGESPWNGVGHYNSYTKRHKLNYLQKVMKNYRILAEQHGSGFVIQ